MPPEALGSIPNRKSLIYSNVETNEPASDESFRNSVLY